MRITHKIALAGGGLLMLGLVGLILFGQNGYIDYLRLKDQNNALIMENKAGEEENLRLRRQVTRLQDDTDYIEYIARKELGMIASDEIIYKFQQQEKKP